MQESKVKKVNKSQDKKSNASIIKDPEFIRELIASIIFLAICTILNSKVANPLIDVIFPNRPLNQDLMFKILPYIGWTQYVTDIAIAIGVVAFVWYLYAEHLRFLPKYIVAYGWMNLLRGCMILLTPMARPTGNYEPYGFFVNYRQYGMFPSGHVATLMVFYMLIDGMLYRKLKIAMLVLLFIEIVSLLLSRGHYSIDIVGGLMVGYFAYKIAFHGNWKELFVKQGGIIFPSQRSN